MSAVMIEVDRCNDSLFDATDYACPAWWRGNERGVEVVCQLVHGWLNGEFQGGEFSGPALNELRARMRNLHVGLQKIASNLGCADEMEHVPLHDGSVIHLPYVQIPGNMLDD